MHIKGQDSERRTATARNAEHLKDICRIWLAGHSDRGIRAEYMGDTTNSPYGEPHEAVAGYIRVWAAKRGWRQEEPKDEQADVLMQAFRVPAGMDVEKVIREAQAHCPAPKAALEAGERVHSAIERAIVDEGIRTSKCHSDECAPASANASLGHRVARLVGKPADCLMKHTDAALVHELRGVVDAELARRGTRPERAMDAPGYEHLAAVLKDAYAQAAFGKGKERHANDLPFDHQPMQAISRLLGNPTGMTYQVCKKVVEAMNMKDRAARRRELLGAIVYLAGVVVYEDNENGNS
jgi:hypothetical protein